MTTDTKKRLKPKGFEASLEKLETIISRLDEDTIPLTESLKLFEEGISLSRQAQSALADAEQKVASLIDLKGSPAVAPASPNDEQ